MSVYKFKVFVVVIIATLLNFSTSFNVDTYYPIIIESVEPSGFGGARLESSFFGASVALLKPDSKGPSWVVIGAPKLNSTVHPEIPEPGGVWQCSLGQTPGETCRPVTLDPRGNLNSDSKNLNPKEWKNNSLLGGPTGLAVSSQAFVACASRLETWVIPPDKDKANALPVSNMHGSCYLRPRSHLYQENPPPDEYTQLNPVFVPELKKSRLNRAGSSGFAVHFSSDGMQLVMSAPGMTRWMGSLIQYLSKDGQNFEKKVVSKAEECPESGRDCFHYLGYSLTSGYYYNKNEVYYAAGAPRAEGLRGKVIVFQFSAEPQDLNVKQTLVGDKVGAYFGSALLSLDVNGDGYDDLLVGAPRFSRDNIIQPRGRFKVPTSRGFFESFGDEGTVYVFLASDKGKGPLVKQTVPLRSQNRPWSHFGTALASLGDLNKDGIPDFCVSAPFQDTSGALYIYHGAKDGKHTEYQQVILGKNVDTGLRGFGFSITGKEDVDNNGFPDVVVGSFGSSSVVVLRTRPVINVIGKVNASLDKLQMDQETFELNSCVSVDPSTSISKAKGGVTFKVNIAADTNFKPHRIHLYKTGQRRADAKSEVEYSLPVTSHDEECTKLVAVVVLPLESSGAAVRFSQVITIPGADNVVRKRTMKVDTTKGSVNVNGATFDDFCKTCPMLSSSTQEQKSEVSLPLAVPCGEDNRCDTDLSLDVRFRDLDGEFVVGSATSVTLDIRLTNRNETAIKPGVLVSWKNLRLTRVPSGCTQQKSQAPGLTSYECLFGRYMKQDESAEVSLEFDMSGLYVSESGGMETQLFWNVTAITVSEMWQPVSISQGLPLSYRADPYIQGSRRLEVFNTATLAKYLVFTHQFDVQLDGFSPVKGIKAVFQLPVNLTTETGISSLVNVRDFKVSSSESDAGFGCKATKGLFSKNVDALTEPTDDVDYDDYGVAGIGGYLPKEKETNRRSNMSLVEKDRLLLHCNSPFVSCMEVTCKKETMFYPGTTEEIKFIIDLASEDIRKLLKVYKVGAVEIESQGQLILSEAIKEVQPIGGANKRDETVAVTLIEKEGHKRISSWVYILAVVIGILILLCVGCCLYALGCFEEKKPADQVDGEMGQSEEMQPLQEKGQEESNDAYNSKAEETNETDALVLPNREMEDGAIPESPFSDMVDPPEFVPTEPPIPEEIESDDGHDKTDNF